MADEGKKSFGIAIGGCSGAMLAPVVVLVILLIVCAVCSAVGTL